jgi:hypothetical protein
MVRKPEDSRAARRPGCRNRDSRIAVLARRATAVAGGAVLAIDYRAGALPRRGHA